MQAPAALGHHVVQDWGVGLVDAVGAEAVDADDDHMAGAAGLGVGRRRGDEGGRQKGQAEEGRAHGRAPEDMAGPGRGGAPLFSRPSSAPHLR